MNIIYIFAIKNGNEYLPENLVENLEDSLANLEYYDVANGQYQIWVYPDGGIFDIRSDREIPSDENQFATPYGSKGVNWKPQLVKVNDDIDQVQSAYESFKS